MMKRTRLPEDPVKKARMQAAALALFASAGYQATKVDAIAAKAQVSKGLIFKYFGNKEQLYLATLRQAYDRLMAIMDEAVWQDSGDLVAMVTNATRYKISLQLQYPREFQLLLNGFIHLKQLPASGRQYVEQMMVANQDLTQRLVLPVFAKMTFKPGITATDALTVLNYVTSGYLQKFQQYLLSHPEVTTVAEMEPLLADLTRYLRIVEYGFVDQA